MRAKTRRGAQTTAPERSRNPVSPYEAAGDRTQDLRIKRTTPMRSEAVRSEPMLHGVSVNRFDRTRRQPMAGTQTQTPTMHNVAVMALQRDDPAIQTTGLAAAMQKLMREPGHRTDC